MPNFAPRAHVPNANHMIAMKMRERFKSNSAAFPFMMAFDLPYTFSILWEGFWGCQAAKENGDKKQGRRCDAAGLGESKRRLSEYMRKGTLRGKFYEATI